MLTRPSRLNLFTTSPPAVGSKVGRLTHTLKLDPRFGQFLSRSSVANKNNEISVRRIAKPAIAWICAATVGSTSVGRLLTMTLRGLYGNSSACPTTYPRAVTTMERVESSWVLPLITHNPKSIRKSVTTRIRLIGGASRNSIKLGNFAPYSNRMIAAKAKATKVAIWAPSAVVPGNSRDGVKTTTTIIIARTSAPTNLVNTASTSNMVSVHANTLILPSDPFRGTIGPISCELVPSHPA